MGAVGSSTGRVGAGEMRMGGRTPASFEEFFEDERVRLYRVLFAIIGSRHEAEDISQDAFLRVWERWDRVAAMDEPVGYLHRVAMNVFRDRRRRLALGMKRAVRLAPPPDQLGGRGSVGRVRRPRLAHPEAAGRDRAHRGDRVLGRGGGCAPRHQGLDGARAHLPGAHRREGLDGEDRWLT